VGIPQKGAGVTTDLEKRRAIKQHWAASEAGDVEVEHRLYADDAILDYPQSGERFVGRATADRSRRLTRT
jgi:ketosteroid isomerase-like protein